MTKNGWSEIELERLRELGDQLRAFELEVFTGDVLDHGRDRSATVQQARLVAGAVMKAASTIIDGLFDELRVLQDSGAQTVSVCDRPLVVLGGLPTRYRHRYTELFVRKFIVSMVAVTSRLTREVWEPPACVAEELALRLLIGEAYAIVDAVTGGATDDAWVGVLYDVAFDDVDHEYLYEPAMDGIEDSPELGPPGMAPMGFDWWFVPFNPERTAPPHVQDPKPSGDQP